jgi:hypothetical protein
MSTIQSGQILHTLGGGLLVSLLVTWLFLLSYRRAVRRTMRTASGAGGVAATSAAPVAPGAPLPASVVLRPDRGPRLRLAAIYATAFGLSAAVLNAPQMLELWRESADGLGALRAAVWWYPNWAAALVIIAALVHATRRQVWIGLAAVVAVGVALSVGAPTLLRLSRGQPLSTELLANAGYFLLAFGLTAALPLALVWLTGRPRVRNVLPLALVLVLSLSLVVMFVYQGFVMLFPGTGELEPTLVRRVAVALGPDAIILALSLPVGWTAWRAAGALAAAYRARAFSDMQLLADAWWGVIAAFALTSLWRYGAGTALVCAGGGWLVYFVTVRALLRGSAALHDEGGPALLLLRVFGHPERTARLYERVASRWRFHGPVAMIAGADLAVHSIDVDEALAYAHGEIESSYVADAAGLERRLTALQARSDPDGRYRVEEFFCFDDTWRATLQALVARSRVVLMDLRGFSAQNAGCVFELQQLAGSGRLADCVLVIDASTDRALAERTLAQALPAGTATTPSWLALDHDRGEPMRALRERLRRIAAGERLSTAPTR